MLKTEWVIKTSSVSCCTQYMTYIPALMSEPSCSPFSKQVLSRCNVTGAATSVKHVSEGSLSVEMRLTSTLIQAHRHSAGSRCQHGHRGKFCLNMDFRIKSLLSRLRTLASLFLQGQRKWEQKSHFPPASSADVFCGFTSHNLDRLSMVKNAPESQHSQRMLFFKLTRLRSWL